MVHTWGTYGILAFM